MNSIQTAYINALLADASYVTDVRVGSISARDFERRLTETQATYLAANFTVLATHQSPDGGFDAVVWQIKTGSPLALEDSSSTGKTFVSMRGTQELQDFPDDISLASKGIPHFQIANMVNWWLKNTAAVTNTEVKQIKVHDAPGLLGAKSAAPARSFAPHSIAPCAASARSRGRFGFKSAPFAKRQHFKKKHRPALMDAA